MKFFIVSFCVLFSLSSKCQTTNSVHLKSDILVELVAENFLKDNQKIVFDKTIGIDVDIYIDTVAKSYSLYFTNPKKEKSMMDFEYIEDFYINGKRQESMYVMKNMDTKFILWDLGALKQMYFIFDKDPKPGFTHFFNLTGVKKVE